jgi:hypothetical protein
MLTTRPPKPLPRAQVLQYEISLFLLMNYCLWYNLNIFFVQFTSGCHTNLYRFHHSSLSLLFHTLLMFLTEFSLCTSINTFKDDKTRYTSHTSKAEICNFSFVLLKQSKTPFQISVSVAYSSFINFLNNQFALGGAHTSEGPLSLISISFTVNLTPPK